MKRKQSILVYRFVQAISIIVSKLIFRCKTLRNEIKGKEGPFVVIANHACAFVPCLEAIFHRCDTNKSAF